MTKNKKQNRKVALKAKKTKQQRYKVIQSSFNIDIQKIENVLLDNKTILNYIDSLIVRLEV